MTTNKKSKVIEALSEPVQKTLQAVWENRPAQIYLGTVKGARWEYAVDAFYNPGEGLSYQVWRVYGGQTFETAVVHVENGNKFVYWNTQIRKIPQKAQDLMQLHYSLVKNKAKAYQL